MSHLLNSGGFPPQTYDVNNCVLVEKWNMRVVDCKCLHIRELDEKGKQITKMAGYFFNGIKVNRYNRLMFGTPFKDYIHYI